MAVSKRPPQAVAHLLSQGVDKLSEPEVQAPEPESSEIQGDVGRYALAAQEAAQTVAPVEEPVELDEETLAKLAAEAATEFLDAHFEETFVFHFRISLDNLLRPEPKAAPKGILAGLKSLLGKAPQAEGPSEEEIADIAAKKERIKTLFMAGVDGEFACEKGDPLANALRGIAGVCPKFGKLLPKNGVEWSQKISQIMSNILEDHRCEAIYERKVEEALQG